MSNIDKRALREVAERATPGNWRRTSSLFNGITVTPFSLCGEEVTLAHTVEKRDAEFIAAVNPPTMLALLDEWEADKEQIKALESRNRRLDGIIYAAEKRVAELESIATDYGLKFQKAQDALKHHTLLHKYQMEAAENNLIDSECHVAELEEALRDKQALLDAAEKHIAELDPAKNGYILLVKDAEPNFDVNANYPVIPDGWISCSERMPEQDDWVLIYSKYGEYLAGQVQGGYVELNDGTLSWLGAALHWMPLPEPPKEINHG